MTGRRDIGGEQSGAQDVTTTRHVSSSGRARHPSPHPTAQCIHAYRRPAERIGTRREELSLTVRAEATRSVRADVVGISMVVSPKRTHHAGIMDGAHDALARIPAGLDLADAAPMGCAGVARSRRFTSRCAGCGAHWK